MVVRGVYSGRTQGQCSNVIITYDNNRDVKSLLIFCDKNLNQVPLETPQACTCVSPDERHNRAFLSRSAMIHQLPAQSQGRSYGLKVVRYNET